MWWLYYTLVLLLLLVALRYSVSVPATLPYFVLCSKKAAHTELNHRACGSIYDPSTACGSHLAATNVPLQWYALRYRSM